MNSKLKWALSFLPVFAAFFIGFCTPAYAATGWVEEDGSWYYYDKYGEPVTNEWAQSNDGNYYYLGEDGASLKDTWVEGDTMYYVDSFGARVENEWKKIIPYEEDVLEEIWYYFGTSGRMSTGKKTIDGKTYYFTDSGRMLTKWVQVDGSQAYALTEDEIEPEAMIVYCNPEGVRSSGWLQLYSPADENELEEQHWYYFKSNGNLTRSAKTLINKNTYLFDASGRMITGWAYMLTATGSDANYQQITMDTYDSAVHSSMDHFMYTGADGILRKGEWINESEPGSDPEEEEKFWYYAGADGSIYAAGGEQIPMRVAAKAAVDHDIGKYQITGTDVQIGFRKIGSKYYAFDETGKMLVGLIRLEESDESLFQKGLYYFGTAENIGMRTGSTTITNEELTDYSYYFSKGQEDGYSSGQAVTGIFSGKLYLNGLLVHAEEDTKYQVKSINHASNNETVEAFYIVNESGRVITDKGPFTADNGVKYRNAARDDNELGYQVEVSKDRGKTWTTYVK